MHRFGPQIPHGPEHLDCPFHQKPMSEVCHKCPLWTQLRGTNPQTGEEIDQWNCAVSMLPLLLVENAQQQRQTGAALESSRNVMAEGFGIMATRLGIAPPTRRPTLEVEFQEVPDGKE